MFGLFTWLKIGLIAAAIAGLGATHYWAYRNGRAVERQATLERSVDTLRERNRTDDQIRNMDDGELCRALGGEWMPDGSCQ